MRLTMLFIPGGFIVNGTILCPHPESVLQLMTRCNVAHLLLKKQHVIHNDPVAMKGVFLSIQSYRFQLAAEQYVGNNGPKLRSPTQALQGVIVGTAYNFNHSFGAHEQAREKEREMEDAAAQEKKVFPILYSAYYRSICLTHRWSFNKFLLMFWKKFAPKWNVLFASKMEPTVPKYSESRASFKVKGGVMRNACVYDVSCHHTQHNISKAA
ncbi:hypothetical protein CBL_09652 [Carabus blaptoides fortunei]